MFSFFLSFWKVKTESTKPTGETFVFYLEGMLRAEVDRARNTTVFCQLKYCYLTIKTFIFRPTGPGRRNELIPDSLSTLEF